MKRVLLCLLALGWPAAVVGQTIVATDPDSTVDAYFTLRFDSLRLRPPKVATITSLALAPKVATLQAGLTQGFSANASWSDSKPHPLTVTWSATGGTISSTGLYTAGASAGSYRVVASASGKADTARVTVTVAPPPPPPDTTPPPPPPPATRIGLYVAPNGTGTVCSKPSPCAVTTGRDKAAPGDTVWVTAGSYVGLLTINRDVTAAQPIVYRAVPVAGGLTRATFPNGIAVNGDYTVLWGLEVTNASGNFGVNVAAKGVRLINLVVHNTFQSGVGHWYQSQGGELYGSLLYDAGTHTNLDHGAYVQNDGALLKVVEDNLCWKNRAYGLHLYGGAPQPVKSILVRGNICWDNAGTGTDGRAEIILASDTKMDAMTVEQNLTYRTDRGRTADLGWNATWGFAGKHGTLTERDNYFVGTVNLPTAKWTTLVQSGNVATTTPGTYTLVRPNRYEPGRANIGVVNGTKAATVAVTVPGVAAWQLRRADNLYGAAVATGSGPTVAVPMAGAEFGAFVVLPR